MGDIRTGKSRFTTLPQINKILKDRGLEPSGEIQQFLAEQVLYYCIDYVPYLTGELAESPLSNGTIEKHGNLSNNATTITWKAEGKNGYNYAGYQYYLQDWFPNPKYSNQNGLRGSHWDKRMMIDHRKDILNSVQKKLDSKGAK